MPGAHRVQPEPRASSRDVPAPAPAISRPSPLAAEVLRLQRSVGNAAVGRLLARCPDGSDPNCSCHPHGRRASRPSDAEELARVLRARRS